MESVITPAIALGLLGIQLLVAASFYGDWKNKLKGRSRYEGKLVLFPFNWAPVVLIGLVGTGEGMLWHANSFALFAVTNVVVGLMAFARSRTI